jgi:hypothetical protein
VPYGAGSLLGLATQGQVDLLTIEFRDEHHAYHGAVFVLPKGTAHRALRQLTPLPLGPPDENKSLTPCDATSIKPRTLTVSAINSADIELPKEHKVALYEQLFSRLTNDPDFDSVDHDGDDSNPASCTCSSKI